MARVSGALLRPLQRRRPRCRDSRDHATQTGHLPDRPNDFYYNGAANNNAGGGIQLPAVHSSGGFDVTNSDGTTYHIRPDTMTISTPGKAPWSEPMLQYASSS